MYQIERGKPHPLGAVPDEQGVNFSIFSQCATHVELLLFGMHDDAEPAQIIPMDPMRHRTYDCWHVYIRGVRPGMYYAYRFDGPNDLYRSGDRFNRNKVILDPYARRISTTLWQRSDAFGSGDNVRTSLRSMVIETSE